MKTLSRGLLIAVEGIDGSGKSTLVHQLHDALKHHDLPVIATRQPGGTPLGQEIRALLHERSDITPKAEYLLFAADRAQHTQTVIKPALDHKRIVLCDRMGDSSVVYQGFGRGLDITLITTINTWALSGITPDLTLYVAIDADTAFERIKKRGHELTSFEKEKKDFFNRLITGYATLYQHRSDVVTLDGTQTPEQLTQQALDAVTTLIDTNA